MKFNPLVLILFNVLVPTSVMFASPVKVNIVAIILVILLLIASGNIKNLILYIIISAVAWMSVYFISEIRFLAWIMMFITIIVSFLPCLMVARILVSNYTSAEILSALEIVNLPKSLIIATTITLRYIPTFKREFSYIKESMRLRGIAFTWHHPIRSFQYFIVPQLFRCIALAEEITSAGMVKGIDNPHKRTSYWSQGFFIKDWIFTILICSSVLGVIIW